MPDPVPAGFFPGPPDLAVEVLSPNDRASEVLAKVSDWLEAGLRPCRAFGSSILKIGASPSMPRNRRRGFCTLPMRSRARKFCRDFAWSLRRYFPRDAV